MSDDQTPTNTLTEAERLDIEHAWVYEGTVDAVIEQVERILAAREAHTNTLRAAVEAVVAPEWAAGYIATFEGDKRTGVVAGITLAQVTLRAALDAAPAPTDNQHNNGLADRETVEREVRNEWADYFDRWTAAAGPRPPTVRDVIDLLRAEGKPFGVSAVVDGPTTPTQEQP